MKHNVNAAMYDKIIQSMPNLEYMYENKIFFQNMTKIIDFKINLK